MSYMSYTISEISQLVFVSQHGLVPPHHQSQSIPHLDGWPTEDPYKSPTDLMSVRQEEEAEKHQVPDLSPHMEQGGRAKEAGETVFLLWSVPGEPRPTRSNPLWKL